MARAILGVVSLLAVLVMGGYTTVPSDMVRIPGGTFTMGSNDGNSDEKPPHQITVNGFWMDVTEVTNTEFKKFVDSSGYRPRRWSYDSGKPNHPAVNVTWNDTVAYCRWAEKRLPTEAEWEYAAGGPDHLKWSFGNKFESSKYSFNRYIFNKSGTEAVGSYPANGYGLYDMSGSVWEWVSSLYKPYPYRADDGREDPSASGSRVLRGGSWDYYASNLRMAYRFYSDPSSGFDVIGFRCVLS
jgi:iron(II)-dependent oxidoreductase